MLIIPAILEQKKDDALTQIARLRGVVPWIQIDVMDGTMTDTQTFDIQQLKGALDDFDVEVHLMSTQPENFFDACAAVGAVRVYMHITEAQRPSDALAAMDPYDFTKGIVLSPQTSVEDGFTYIDEVDAVQIMTVVPGAQGGTFLAPMLEKITDIRARRSDVWISVDGGVNQKTIADVMRYMPDAVGVGSAISRATDPQDVLAQLARTIQDHYAC